MHVARAWDAFWAWIDERAIVRRAFMVATFVVFVWTLQWSFRFAETSARDGMHVAAILGALWAPLNGLLGFMFGRYSSSRNE